LTFGHADVLQFCLTKPLTPGGLLNLRRAYRHSWRRLRLCDRQWPRVVRRVVTASGGQEANVGER
jgi:hypothetical protein